MRTNIHSELTAEDTADFIAISCSVPGVSEGYAKYHAGDAWQSPDTAIEAWSIQKLNIARLVLEQQPDEKILEYNAKTDKPQHGGTGYIQYSKNGFKIGQSEALKIMLSESDNALFKLFVRKLGGPAATNQRLASLELGATQLELLDEPDAEKKNRFNTGTTSVEDVLSTLEALKEHTLAIDALKQSIGGAIIRGYKNHELRPAAATTGKHLMRALGPLSMRLSSRLLDQIELPETDLPVKKGNGVFEGISYFHEAGFDRRNRPVVILSAMPASSEPPEQSQTLRKMYKKLASEA